MVMTAVPTYPPLDTLKPVADDVWIVDGPAIRFGALGLTVPFPTRMTVIRLGRDLFLHSPTEAAPELRSAIDRLGRVAWIVAPNRLHYWWVPDWHMAYPQAGVYLAPRIAEQAGGRIAFPGSALEARAGYPWDDAISTLPIAGRFMTEVVFFHRASRTLVLTDLIENFEAEKLASPWLRWLIRFGGVLAPDGQMPRDMRLTYSKPMLRAAVETMLGWDPERVIIAHGKWLEHDGARELRRAFRWLLR
jgi:hypothetical protein